MARRLFFKSRTFGWRVLYPMLVQSFPVKNHHKVPWKNTWASRSNINLGRLMKKTIFLSSVPWNDTAGGVAVLVFLDRPSPCLVLSHRLFYYRRERRWKDAIDCSFWPGSAVLMKRRYGNKNHGRVCCMVQARVNCSSPQCACWSFPLLRFLLSHRSNCGTEQRWQHRGNT